MNIKELKDLIYEILQSDICDFELEHTGTKLRLRRGSPSERTLPAASMAPHRIAATSPPPPPIAAPAAAAAEPQEFPDDGLHVITSPIVGTFYRSPSLDAEPFVEVGRLVEEGATLCIVEAMKLMNEIPSDIAGEVVRIYVENGHAVEYGQKLIGIQPRR